MVTTLFPFVANSRNYGSGGPQWVPTGVEPRMLDYSDGNYMSVNTVTALPDSESLDSVTWKQSNGTIMPWQDKLITNVSLNISVFSNTSGVTIGMVIANSALGGAVSLGTLPLSLIPSTMTHMNLAGAAVNPPPTNTGWWDRMRDLLIAQDLLFSLIVSNRFSVANFNVQVHRIYLDVTWSYLRRQLPVTEY